VLVTLSEEVLDETELAEDETDAALLTALDETEDEEDSDEALDALCATAPLTRLSAMVEAMTPWRIRCFFMV
jgi:CMP-N-acetylneuraminic acid synthetase